MDTKPEQEEFLAESLPPCGGDPGVSRSLNRMNSLYYESTGYALMSDMFCTHPDTVNDEHDTKLYEQHNEI